MIFTSSAQWMSERMQTILLNYLFKYLKSVGYIEALDVGNPPVPLIINARIPLSAAADVQIYSRASGLPLLLTRGRERQRGGGSAEDY